MSTTPAAIAFALLARSLGEDVVAVTDPDHVEALRRTVGQLGDVRLARLAAELPVADLDVDTLAGRWVRWFDLGRVAPYEASNVVVTAGGITPRLADVAGFYRAFGMSVTGNRPDHVVAELEFVALVLLHERDAVDTDDPARAEVCGDVLRTFLRDHVGTWLDGWAARIAEIDELAPWLPHARLAAALVAAEAAHRNVVPARSEVVHPGARDVAPDTEAELRCGADDPELGSLGTL